MSTAERRVVPLLDSRPLSEQKFTDIEAFLRQGVAENLTLDYKRELGNSTSERAEMCKDVSSLANSQGGMIVYGIEENQDRTPRLPAFGTARAFGRQNVEEWAAQVLQSGVQPRMDFEVEAFPLQNDPDRCVLVVRTQAGPSAPHMVTFNGNNRYYGRFYRRSSFDNRIAEEYEVREMLERARRLYLGLEDELRRRGYSDPRSPSFGDSSYNRRLAAYSPDRGVYDASRWISFLLLPTITSGTASTDRDGWLQWLDPNQLKYEPEPNELYVPHARPRPVLGGVASLKPAFEDGRMIANLLDAYLRVGFDGSIEYGFAPIGEVELSSDQTVPTVPFFKGRAILVKLWQTLGFAADVRARLSIATPHLLSVNITNTEETILSNFAEGWENPTENFRELREGPRCLEPNVQIQREFRAEDFEDVSTGTASEPPRQVKELASDVCFAFGISDPVLFPQR
jgi:hypothetical protein